MSNLVYPNLFKNRLSIKKPKKVIVSSSVNEYHQVGGKIVTDIFELNGWKSFFLGANTPSSDLMEIIDEEKPDIVGISLSIYFNMPGLKQTIEKIKTNFNNQNIFVGGQAFRWGGSEIAKGYSGTEFIPSITELEKII